MELVLRVVLPFYLMASSASTLHLPSSPRVSSISSTQMASNFPDSETVLDMIMLSDAVYYLRNKVTSCTDPQTNNRTLVSSTRHEILSTSEDEQRKMLRRLSVVSKEDQNLFDVLLPEGITCLHYSHDYDLGTQVLVVRSSINNYISVVYAGTDDFTTALMDGDIVMGKFGPITNSTAGEDNKNEIDRLFDQVPEGAHVHKGFNSAVFDSYHYSKVLECVKSARLGGSCDGPDDSIHSQEARMAVSEPYKLYTTGHSLGAADSVLLGVALHLAFPSENIQSINFGCPKIGNVELSYWIDSLQPGQSKSEGSLSVFRFVNKLDLVPRLPDLVFFQHAGHTLQMSTGGEIRAYYNHWGDADLGYAGVPFGWDAEPYVLFPLAIYAHHHKHYVQFLQEYAPQHNSSLMQQEPLYFVKEFERVEVDEATETGPTPGLNQ